MSKIQQDINLSDPNSLINTFKSLPEKEIKATLVEAEKSPKDRIPPEKANLIMEDFAKKNQTSRKDALIGLTYLVQEGGTNTSKKNLKRTVNGVTMDIEDLRNIIRVHVPNGTVRQLAKTYRDVIALIALTNGWPGPLLKELSRANPQLNISSNDAIYCCEIHTDNETESMPKGIRDALRNREAKLRENSSNTKSQPKKAQKKGKKKK